jgi:2-polyprenyl-3-methyl-5-hydroxy-6-metoxy-1,4-benzoquinol methylase
VNFYLSTLAFEEIIHSLPSNLPLENRSNMSQTGVNSLVAQNSPWLRSWSKEYIENVYSCPVCASVIRSTLFSNLIDNTYFTAAGIWTLCRCGSCGSAYLDPRPTSGSIGEAYENYFTHKDEGGQIDSAKLGLLRRVRRMLANGYINNRYGTKRSPAIDSCAIFNKWLPGRSVMDSQFRYLPRPVQGQCLLDIGCGNGDFLINAQEMGWKASGLEPDPAAVKVAEGRGLNIFMGTIDVLNDRFGCFDAVTISHVIEHVYQPRAFLQAVHRLLKTDGIIYIDTPNIQSHGAKIFGSSWRGIEAPRHLTLFNPKSLKDLLIECGYQNIEFRRRTDVQRGMWLSSKKISASRPSDETERITLGWWARQLMESLFVKTDRLEFITLTARKKN